ncbi:YuzF family protein [Oceanobacillus rekensis]|uniref:YuzF family protein n=1 Tax=Oceanobacillus rekensis TaxID=937927 RepID=UPI000B44B83A|nr:YuzF family protein [Oceanobacillus rekensis]
MNDKWNLSDPYVYEALTGLLNKSLAVQTPRGSVRGVLRKVMPDHIVIHMGGAPFYIRTDQIIWFHPEAVRISQDSSDI